MNTLISPNQVADKLGISVRHLYNLLNSPDFPNRIKIGQRAVRFKESEINEWIESRTETSKGA